MDVLFETAGARYSFSLTMKLPLIPSRCLTSAIFINSLQYEIFSVLISVMYLNFTSLSLASRNDFLIGDIHSQLGNLEMMIADEPANQRASLNELNILKDLIQAKLAGLNQTMTLQQLHSINAALPIILRNPGKTLMDNIRATGVNIQSQQNNMLDLGNYVMCQYLSFPYRMLCGLRIWSSCMMICY